MSNAKTRQAIPFSADLREMMNAWDTIRAAARAQYPAASEAEIDTITRGAMNHSLGLAS
jgi:hypothetical protein